MAESNAGLAEIACDLKRVSPEGLVIAEWSEIGADAIELIDGLRGQKGG